MSASVTVVNTVRQLRDVTGRWRREGLRTGFVPTMGALHEGHLSLVGEALKNSDRAVVSIFVNPTQFGPGEDFARYPRQEERDCELLGAAGAHLVFIPSAEEMYPEGDSTTVHLSGLTERLEGSFRPGHFDGVATVVTKLLLQCMPDIAVFGEKDYQQLAVIRRTVLDLSIPVKIIGAPIVRDDHGLALSSRNAYLSDDSLAVARRLNKVLSGLADEICRSPGKATHLCVQGTEELKRVGFDQVDYLELVDARTLERMKTLDRPARLLVTARIGGVRLLDNIAVSP